jgi:hypothetical protein
MFRERNLLRHYFFISNERGVGVMSEQKEICLPIEFPHKEKIN